MPAVGVADGGFLFEGLADLGELRGEGDEPIAVGEEEITDGRRGVAAVEREGDSARGEACDELGGIERGAGCVGSGFAADAEWAWGGEGFELWEELEL